MLYKVIVSVQSIVGMLFGLNRLYVHQPAFKWQKHSLEMMDIVPNHSFKRFSSILLEDPLNVIKELEIIVQEVYQFIQHEFPRIDVSKVINQSLFLRPKNRRSQFIQFDKDM
ncbi:hypothetical protein [Heyndrickxia ginsengihumi]|uniref:Uncharacterized protein n=1 Tax=Heyndrickxia ginsengihumi TaxID=363870 RepID=A0A6M0P6U1_9BACI|nr:hypothetical protein [Heyndrickxia ginsengihumi]MCM3024419.1 hypothetical protein [Heyndrickxia ginsengihumi]NEY20227.1 hypothetical protein [Heyndrickxia ginsengihumi]